MFLSCLLGIVPSVPRREMRTKPWAVQLRRNVCEGSFQGSDVFGLLGHLRAQSHQFRTLIRRKRLTAIRIWLVAKTGSAHPPPLITHPGIQQVLVQTQFAGNISDTPMAIDHPMCGFDSVLRSK